MKVWIDIDNPPQVQYLLPVRGRFAELGMDTVVTARDYGSTLALLRQANAAFHALGSHFGKSMRHKIGGVLQRAYALRRLFGRIGRPDLLVCASRSAALSAYSMRIPSFIIGDYEYSNVTAYTLTRSYILYPNVIDPRAFLERGFPASRLIPFTGLKEDISFAGVDVDAIPAHSFADKYEDDVVRVLFRPPAEESHYHRQRSRQLALELMEYLAERENVGVVFSARYGWQNEYVRNITWKVDPIVLETPIPFVSLLKGVDIVVSSGGTMLREAAYLGVPAYSIFQSKIGGVDRYLAALGRLTLLSSSADFGKIQLRKTVRQPVLASNPRLLEEVVEAILERTTSRETVAKRR